MSGFPRRLEAEFKEKVWGSRGLGPWYPDAERKIGEVWFTAGEPLPLLIKFIFTSENLSVQVHPGDEYAALHENSPGKTEMWHVLRAAPSAKLALGTLEPMTGERLREAAVSGEIEQLLRWIEPAPGDTFFVPAGVIHAIGGGLAICEIQQPSDITYRLYDYGRPRELHLDRAIDVADPRPHPGRQAPGPVRDGWQLLVECEHFRTERRELSAPIEYRPGPERAEFLIVLEGAGAIAGQPFQMGETWLAPPASAPFPIEPHGAVRLLRTSARS